MTSDKSHPYLNQNKPWIDNDNAIWIASTIHLSRNIEKYKFPGKLEADRQKQIVSVLGKELMAAPHLSKPRLFHSDQITPAQKQFLMEHFLSTQGFQQAHSGEAFVLSEAGDFLAVFNVNDHLSLCIIDSRGELEQTWNRLVEIETTIGKAVNYAYSPRFGFMTADPAISGTGLVVSIYLQISGLIHLDRIDEVLDKLNDESIYVSGMQGNPTEVIGDILVVQNNYTQGVTEENIFSGLRSFASKLLMEENSARKEIKQQENNEIKDRVSRAFGILIHSYHIEAVEALNAISLLKLGQSLGWISGISCKDLNQLFFNCRRAHLLAQFKETIPQEQILHKRSEYIHSALKEVKLMI